MSSDFIAAAYTSFQKSKGRANIPQLEGQEFMTFMETHQVRLSTKSEDLVITDKKPISMMF